MRDTTNFIAVDIGASSGRVMLGRWDGARFTLEDLHRFWNGPVEQGGQLRWNAPRLLAEIQAGLAAYASRSDAPLAGIGIDTWAVDYGQRLPFNTIYQLASAAGDPQLAAAETLLLMPDLLAYWLTGQRVAEYTNATTTQLLDARTRTWSAELLDALGIPAHILPPLVEPGTLLGNLLPALRDAAGLRHDVPVIATATHDTASAVVAVPGLDAHSAYISSGTWSLVGVELPAPILSAEAQQLSITNEGGVGGTIRFLKNVGGLWLLQECQRQWEQEGRAYTWPELVALAEAAAPRRSIVDPDAPEFLAPGDMPTAIRAYCRSAGQPEPEDVGALVRCCLESLALKYRWVIEALERLTGRQITTIRVVGGGSQNSLLCQLTADACGRPVVAGPVEATALGNILVQAVATGHLPDIAAGRRAVAESFPQMVYLPKP
jgi:rhamnulokinase